MPGTAEETATNSSAAEAIDGAVSDVSPQSEALASSDGESPGSAPAAETDSGSDDRSALYDAFTKAIDKAADDPVESESPAAPPESPTAPSAMDEGGAPATPTAQQPAPAPAPDAPPDLTEEEMSALAPRTQERMRYLSAKAREADEVREQFNELGARAQQFTRELEEVGLGPQEMQAIKAYARAMNSGDQQTVKAYLDAQEQLYTQRFGQSIGEHSALDMHPDLKEKVNNLEISQEFAEQVAAERAQSQRTQGLYQQTEQQRLHEFQQQQEAQLVSAKQQITNQISAKEQEWKAKDPDFSMYEQGLVDFINTTLPEVPMHLWETAIDGEYKRLSGLAKAWGTKQRGRPDPNSIRPQNTGGRPAADGQDAGMREAIFGRIGMTPPRELT